MQVGGVIMKAIGTAQGRPGYSYSSAAERSLVEVPKLLPQFALVLVKWRN